jgi:hypothetical protein
MKAFHCDRCGSLVFFENYQCVKCKSRLAFEPGHLDLATLDEVGENLWRSVARPEEKYRRCANDLEHSVCNWLVPANDPEAQCISCRANEVIPDLTAPGNLERWSKIETAKRRALYTLLHLGLFKEETNVRFRFLGDTSDTPVLTGHSKGVITLNVIEADDVEREKRRVSFREPYRTLLGHFRHELGHYYWDRIIAGKPSLERFRELFGDPGCSYSGALQAYYQAGPPVDWQLQYVSAYATAHPWEDWAETWAHYMHIVDTLETAASFGMSLKPKHPDASAMTADPSRVVEQESSFNRLLRHWFPLTYALNSLNRGMGLPDLYPFVLSDAIIEKLRFVHEVVAEAVKKPDTLT